jgi:hypothetical protein
MIPTTAIPGIRKENIVVFVVTDPIATTLRLCKPGGLAAQATPGALSFSDFRAVLRRFVIFLTIGFSPNHPTFPR